MVETSARLLRLLSLLEVKPDWPGAELAERLEVTPRTLRRDIAKLRSLGYPVYAEPGVAGGYRLGPAAAAARRRRGGRGRPQPADRGRARRDRGR
jgi:predicted DNA-binding transcriptional regulator YafY